MMSAYIVKDRGHGSEVIHTKTGLSVAWCGESFSSRGHEVDHRAAAAIADALSGYKGIVRKIPNRR